MNTYNKYTIDIFESYQEVKNLNEANIFHLYDTGEQCYKDNSGYWDSRHFNLWAYNTETNEKCYLGKHDAISSYSKSEAKILQMRIYIDGSFFIRFDRVVSITPTQNVYFV